MTFDPLGSGNTAISACRREPIETCSLESVAAALVGGRFWPLPGAQRAQRRGGVSWHMPWHRMEVVVRRDSRQNLSAFLGARNTASVGGEWLMGRAVVACVNYALSWFSPRGQPSLFLERGSLDTKV